MINISKIVNEKLKKRLLNLKPEIEYDDRLTPDNCDARGEYPMRTAHYCPCCKIEQLFWFRGYQKNHGVIKGGFYDCSNCGDTWLWRK